jgi:catechol 2,3-dioxygenase-like lactoylglutathione lyase family enzyme
MLDHVSFGSNNLIAARAFYLPVMATLGLRIVAEEIGLYVDFGVDEILFSLETPFDGRPASVGNGSHICFKAKDRATVDAFYAAAIAAGARCDGPPGLRPKYHANYYGAFVRDLDGNKIEAVCHTPA